MRRDFNLTTSLLMFIIASYALPANSTQIEYIVPEGFLPVEQDLSMQLLASMEGKPLPGVLSWSEEYNHLIFDEKRYKENGIDEDTIKKLKKILKAIPYSECTQGCDETILGYQIILDKANQSISITDENNKYLLPITKFGLVHNQFLDVRTASNNFRSIFASGQSYFGLPSLSYGYINWFYNQSKYNGTNFSDKGLSAWYLQKNFTSTYLRGGKQDSLDTTSGGVSTSLNPSFNGFITLGSQDNLAKNDQSVGKLILFSSNEGVYEFWRDGRMIRQVPAIIGRNEIDYNLLPGGFYDLEIRLVDYNGQIVNRENQQIINVNYNKSSGWYVTIGRHQLDNNLLLSTGSSYQTPWFIGSSALLKKAGNVWAFESNMNRPVIVNDINATPTLGALSGEQGVGGYARLNIGNQTLGTLTLSRYQRPNISKLYQANSSSNLSYSRSIYDTRVSYNYSRYNNGEQHRLQNTWNWRADSFWAIVTLGVQKGGYNTNNDYGIFLNTTITLNQNNGIGTLNAAYVDGRVNASSSYARNFEDSYGTSKVGVDLYHTRENNAVSIYSQRKGTRGDVSLRIGHDGHITNSGFNYQGMMAINQQGVAFGQTSPSGSVMLVNTPTLENGTYGFNVENYPVGSSGVYAVPIAGYKNIPFARAQGMNKDVDMDIRIPANIVRAHPGQVYSVDAEVKMNLLYNGFLVTSQGTPISGLIQETGDTVYPNGLFSITSSTLLKYIQVIGDSGHYLCDLSEKKSESHYVCIIN